jgi:uncharacterized membrane protein
MATVQSAKHPRTTVAGPYGHPIHPMMVTIPIGAWTASLIFDIVAASASGDNERVFATGAFWLIVVGLVGAVLAAVFGLMDLSTIPRGTKAFSTGITHLTLNTIVVVLYVVNLIVRNNAGREEFSTAGLVLSIVAIAVLSASGWLGGRLSYHYGVRVADESTQREGFVQTGRR